MKYGQWSVLPVLYTSWWCNYFCLFHRMHLQDISEALCCTWEQSRMFWMPKNFHLLQPPSAVSMLCLWSFLFPLCVLSTDSNPDCCTDSQGGPSGLPQAVARAHSYSAGVREGSGWPAAAQSTPNLLSCHQNPCVQTSGTGQAAFPGREFRALALYLLLSTTHGCVTQYCLF